MMGNWFYRYQVAAWDEAPYVVNWNSEAVSGGGHIGRHSRMILGELTQGSHRNPQSTFTSDYSILPYFNGLNLKSLLPFLSRLRALLLLWTNLFHYIEPLLQRKFDHVLVLPILYGLF